jgi:hypothetical protein
VRAEALRNATLSTIRVVAIHSECHLCLCAASYISLYSPIQYFGIEKRPISESNKENGRFDRPGHSGNHPEKHIATGENTRVRLHAHERRKSHTIGRRLTPVLYNTQRTYLNESVRQMLHSLPRRAERVGKKWHHNPSSLLEEPFQQVRQDQSCRY